VTCPSLPGLPPVPFTPPSAWVDRPDYTTTVTTGGTTTLTVNSGTIQFFTGTMTQNVVLPVVSTLWLGAHYEIVNVSTADILVYSSGMDLIATVAAGSSATFTAVSLTGTTAASWSYMFCCSMLYSTYEPDPTTYVLRDPNGTITAVAFVPSFSTTATSGGTTSLTVTSAEQQVFDGTMTHTVIMPDPSTLRIGRKYQVINRSTQTVTVQSLDTSTIAIIQPGDKLWLTLISTAGTGPTSWDWAYLTVTTPYTNEQAQDSVAGAIAAGTSTGMTVAYNDVSNSFDFAVDYGATSNTACEGNDARLSDARTPTGAAGGDLTGTYPNPTIVAGAVTYAKMQDVSATARVIGRKTAGSGDPEEVTLSELLDFVGSAADGDILYRGGGVWVRLPAGSNGEVLTLTSGVPSWEAGGGGTTGTNGAHQLAVYTLTNSYADSGSQVTLPNTGTYLVTVDGYATFSNGNVSDLVQVRLQIGGVTQGYAQNVLQTVVATVQHSGTFCMKRIISATASDVVKLQGQYSSGAGGMVGGALNEVTMNYVQLD
jgi:hypothetical protein